MNRFSAEYEAKFENLHGHPYTNTPEVLLLPLDDFHRKRFDRVLNKIFWTSFSSITSDVLIFSLS